MIRHIKFAVILYVTFIVHQTFSKTFETCELVRELRKQGFPEHQLNEWICLIEAESTRRTGVRGGPNSDGSFDYGLFQINDRYWCNYGSPGKGCNVQCSDLLTDDITRASQCAKTIYNIHGFNAWVGWNNKCRGRQLPQPYC